MKKTIFTIVAFLSAFAGYTQFFVGEGAEVTSTGDQILYSNEDVINQGTIQFFAATDFIVDGDFTNTAATSTLDFGDARFVIGSGGPNANTTNELRFKPREGSTQIGDVVRFVLLNKDSGEVTVVEGHLGIFDSFESVSGTLNAANPAEGIITLLNRSASQVAQVVESSGGDARLETERYFSDNRAWRFISPSVTSLESIQDNWMEGATNTNQDPVSGFGTHITGNTSNGFDENTSGNPSLFTFDNPTQAWGLAPNVDTDNLISPTAYRILVRGDRSVNTMINDFGNSPETVLRSRGDLNVGDMPALTSLSSTDGQFNLIGNPYHSQVDMEAVLLDASTTGIRNTHYYIWDPNISDNGGYVTIDFNSGTNPSGSDANQYLQPMQAAFVESDGSVNPSLVFRESHKKADVEDPTATFAIEKYINLKLFSSEDYTPFGLALDGMRINFGDGNLNTSEDDFLHPRNLDETLSRFIGDNRYSIEYRQNPELFEVLQLQLDRFRHTNYVFEVSIVNEFEQDIFIHDQYTEEMFLIEGEHFTYEFSVDDSIDDSVDPFRFQIVFGDETFSTDEFEDTAFALYPNPSRGDFSLSGRNLTGATQVEVYNQLGQQVFGQAFDANGEINVQTSGLSTGVYIVRVKTENTQESFKLQIK